MANPQDGTPLLLPAVLPRPPASRRRPFPFGSLPLGAAGAVLVRFRRYVMKLLQELATDPDLLQRMWYALVGSEEEQRRWARPRVRVPVRLPVVAAGAGGGLRRFVEMLVAREHSYNVMMAAAAVAISGVLIAYGARRGAAGDAEEDPRRLPLEVRRNLRVMAFRLLPPTAIPPTRWSHWAAPVGVAGAGLPWWPQRAAPTGFAGVGQDRWPQRSAQMGVAGVVPPRSPARVDNVHLTRSLQRGPLATPIGNWTSSESSFIITSTNCSSVQAELQPMVYDTKGKFEMESITRENNSVVHEVKTKFDNERNHFNVMQPKCSLEIDYSKSEATHDKFCNYKAAHVQNFEGEGMDTVPVIQRTDSENVADAEVSTTKKMKQVESCIDRSKYTNMKLQACLGALSRRKIADTEVSLQGDKSISAVPTPLPPFHPGHDAAPTRVRLPGRSEQ